MKRTVIAGLAALGVLGAGSAWAQPAKGSGTFTLSGVVNTQFPEDGGAASATGMFQLGLGTFVASRTQLFVGPTVTISTNGGGFGQESSVTASVGATVGIKQLFGSVTSKTLPYIGLQTTVTDFGSSGPSFDFDGSGGSSSILDRTLVGANVGFKSYFRENVALDLSAQMGAPVRNFSSGLRNLSLVAAIEYIF